MGRRDRQAGIDGHGGRPAEPLAAFCGQLRVYRHFCEAADPQAKGKRPSCPDSARRWTMRVPPGPHLRLGANDYSLDPALVGRRVEVIIEPAHRHGGRAGRRRGRLPARARPLPPPHGHRDRARPRAEDRTTFPRNAGVRPPARYDALIA